jgi:hypothetical protein
MKLGHTMEKQLREHFQETQDVAKTSKVLDLRQQRNRSQSDAIRAKPLEHVLHKLKGSQKQLNLPKNTKKAIKIPVED